MALKQNNKLHGFQQNGEEMFRKLPAPLVVVDGEGNVLLANLSSALALDLSLDRMMQSNIRELYHKKFYDKSYALEAVQNRSMAKGLMHTRANLVMNLTSTPILGENVKVNLVVTSSTIQKIGSKVMGKDRHRLSDSLQRETAYLHSYVLDTGELVAKSKVMREVLLMAHSVAQTDISTVLFGESGTGKEVLAKYIHQHSKRSQGPFIALNCATLPENLVESELFGYEKGAFTGANANGQIGLFEAANHGTLFLDEIAELPLPIQAKLLRVLETSEIRRLGSWNDRKIDVRIISATHKDLKQMVAEGTFRQDLYYRLHVVPITIPPLRERKEDIIALASQFIQSFAEQYGVEPDLSVEIMEPLLRYSWPGNVRELRNEMEKRVVLSLQKPFCDELTADIEHLYPVTNSVLFKVLGVEGDLRAATKKFEKQYIQAVLKSCGGRMNKAAEQLGICRMALYNKIKFFEK